MNVQLQRRNLIYFFPIRWSEQRLLLYLPFISFTAVNVMNECWVQAGNLLFQINVFSNCETRALKILERLKKLKKKKGNLPTMKIR